MARITMRNSQKATFAEVFKIYISAVTARGVKDQTIAKTYNKLVRDRIPEIIESSGKTCLTATLSDESYIHMLDLKLNEELTEYQESKSMDELADLIEVIAAVAKARGCSWEELLRIRNQKRGKRGGFEKRIFLMEVSDTPTKKANANLPENSGKPWTAELDQQLCNMFDCGASVKEMCEQFIRSRGGIAARLVRLGKIENRADLK